MSAPVASDRLPDRPAARPIPRLLIPELDKCIQCGFCLQHCPTYRMLGMETESPRGRIHLVEAAAQGRIPIDARFEEHMYVCLACRACETACPAGVQFGTIIEAARAELGPPGSPAARALARLALRHLLPYPGRLRTAAALLRFYQQSGAAALAGRLPVLPRRLREMQRLLPAVPGRFFEAPDGVVPAIGARRARVGLLSGCVMSLLFPHLNEATVRVLRRSGCEVVVPRGQTCCGALNLHNGERESAQAMARRNIDAFLDAGVDAVVINAAGCGSTSKEYGTLLRGDPAYAGKAERYGALCRDLSEFLVELGPAPLPAPSAPATGAAPAATAAPTARPLRVTYQDPCHLAHGQRIRRQPRDLLRRIPGVELVEMEASDRCCGSAGIYNLVQPEYSRRILEEKLAAIAATGAEAVVAPNPGCMLQIASGLRARQMPIAVYHLIELLDRAYADGAPAPDRHPESRTAAARA
jgi:Fe-S oxidoreductase